MEGKTNFFFYISGQTLEAAAAAAAENRTNYDGTRRRWSWATCWDVDKVSVVAVGEL